MDTDSFEVQTGLRTGLGTYGTMSSSVEAIANPFAPRCGDSGCRGHPTGAVEQVKDPAPRMPGVQ